ncbi:uncharacterized protein FTOL_13905 [Fusarium torulosum]|uniref:Uncharacterized protein n=1 Tax=Fusarium torulosum TaxID=33205 RepID=A0AAE8SQF1_9HYPO|nr:uncharacterized protein FTOL_13905 [Fusarium torulosum]
MAPSFETIGEHWKVTRSQMIHRLLPTGLRDQNIHLEIEDNHETHHGYKTRLQATGPSFERHLSQIFVPNFSITSNNKRFRPTLGPALTKLIASSGVEAPTFFPLPILRCRWP